MNKVINSTSGTIKYRLKDVKSKSETSIILDYSFGRNNRIKYATGYKVLPSNWDKDKQRIKAVSTISNREKVNSDLLKFSSEFTNKISKLDEQEKQDKNVLKQLLDNVIRNVEEIDKPAITFMTYATEFIRAKENQAKNIDAVKLSPITVRSYNQTVNRLIDFNKELKYNLDFDNIDLKFYYAFVQYLEAQNYSKNTIGKHVKNLKTILNQATEEGVNTNLKYRHRDFKVISKETVSIYLTESEIDSLFKVDLSKTPDWELARDIFLIGYYTGQRISDYNGITKEQIEIFEGREVFKFKQQKTDKFVYVPIHKRIKEIMNKRYNGFPPPILNAPDINEFIKEAGRKAEINDPITLHEKEEGKMIKRTVPKHQLIVSHTARRSFCTNAYLSKMPVIDIMAISGHSTEREFYKYIKVTPQERAIKIADSNFFK